MSLQSELTRLQDNVTSISSSKDAIMAALESKGVTVPSGATLHDVPRLIGYIDGIAPPPNQVTIGNITYNCKQIGSLIWISENLRNVTQHCWDPQYPSEINGKLYKPYYFSEIQDLLPSGWRIPSLDDVDTLQSVSSSSNDYILESLGGTNTTGFSSPLPGYINSGGSFTEANNMCLIWTTTKYDDTSSRNLAFKKNSNVDFSDWSFGNIDNLKNTCLSVRVCKDAV